MKFWIGITDGEWFRQLAALQPDEVNFWRPSGRTAFQSLEPGTPFLFKLHSPDNFIVGGGFFVRDTILPVSLAWDAFQERNGTKDRVELLTRIGKYRVDKSFGLDPQIGCTILAEPFFLDRSEWIAVPEDWPKSTQTGKTYDTATETGRRLWDAVREAMMRQPVPAAGKDLPAPRESGEAFGSMYLTRARLGQGAFRVLVTDAYQRRCAVTGERTLPVLQAAHIKPYAESGPNRVSNGLLLRSDLHILFDRGYVTINRDYRLEVSPRIREEFENGRQYYAMAGSPLVVLPERPADRPCEDFIEWHNEKVYVG
jgi:putative restriction endonuclease